MRVFIICCQLIYFLSGNNIKDIQDVHNTDYPKDSLIQWSDSVNLSWEDYRKNPALATKHINHDAITCTYIGYFNLARHSDSLIFDFICYFDKNASWTKKRTEALLSHEQGHFDIAEIYVRKVRRSLSEYNPTDYNDAVLRYNFVNDSILSLKKITQNQYDLDTDYSRDLTNQLRWEKWIDSSLVSLENWKDTKVKMTW